MRFTAFLIALLFVTATPHAFDAPLDITADELTVMPDKNTAIFSGNVQLVQEDITLNAGAITITSTDQNQDVKSVVASKSVTFHFKGGKAKGNRAEWTPSSNVIKLTGNVTLTQSGNTLTGTALVYNINTGRAKLSAGSSGRVKAVFGQ